MVGEVVARRLEDDRVCRHTRLGARPCLRRDGIGKSSRGEITAPNAEGNVSARSRVRRESCTMGSAPSITRAWRAIEFPGNRLASQVSALSLVIVSCRLREPAHAIEFELALTQDYRRCGTAPQCALPRRHIATSQKAARGRLHGRFDMPPCPPSGGWPTTFRRGLGRIDGDDLLRGANAFGRRSPGRTRGPVGWADGFSMAARIAAAFFPVFR